MRMRNQHFPPTRLHPLLSQIRIERVVSSMNYMYLQLYINLFDSVST